MLHSTAENNADKVCVYFENLLPQKNSGPCIK